jgi:hypothetical protein
MITFSLSPDGIYAGRSKMKFSANLLPAAAKLPYPQIANDGARFGRLSFTKRGKEGAGTKNSQASSGGKEAPAVERGTGLECGFAQ